MDTNEVRNAAFENDGRSTRRGWTRWAIGGSLVVAIAGGVGIASATSPSAVGDHRIESGDSTPQVIRAHWGGRRFMERRVGRVLEEIEATPEQEEKLWKIIDETFATVWPMAREFRGTHEEVHDLLSAPTIDRAAIETLRSERVAAVDELSRKVTAAVIEAAEVLTPEQRAELAEILEERRGHRRW